MFQRKIVATIAARMQEDDNPLLQVVAGPRQTGKSTAIAQALDQVEKPFLSASADDIITPNIDWLRTEWQQARNLQRNSEKPTILVLDEVQKVAGWPNAVKGLWDADQREQRPLKVILSGSSSLLLRKGLEDSLKGRFEVLRSTHWSLAECRKAFGFTLDDFLFFGGFPGAARLADDERRWRAYMRDSIIEPTISNDVLEQEDVRKPALMRALFELGARFSAQELSYNKMLGQLQDAGNTATLAHYLTLLDKAGVLRGLEKYDPKAVKRKKSSPRLMVYDTALMTAASGRAKELLLSDPELRGHLVESAIGARLLALGPDLGFNVHWWREGNNEVDFVLEGEGKLAAIEVKSGRTKSQGGMAVFLRTYPEATRIVVGGSAAGAVSIEDFLLGDVALPWS
ncbi:ATP-binding protein [Adlercreutzia sp. ZJ138]|uniref:ATP-binding protein n=1 Tax=Adlercreutzia sp. ZJ138 TaxID=2709405 RepID=UPI0013EC1F65|nr:ATP-binding protein [Adlercreutzia sp. ZJ138]